jgi:hypothetical protein
MEQPLNLYVLTCDCHSELITVEHDTEYDQVYLAIWDHYPAISWKHRIRWVWHLITTGRPYADSVVLSKESVERLIYALSNKSRVE